MWRVNRAQTAVKINVDCNRKASGHSVYHSLCLRMQLAESSIYGMCHSTKSWLWQPNLTTSKTQWTCCPSAKHKDGYQLPVPVKNLLEVFQSIDIISFSTPQFPYWFFTLCRSGQTLCQGHMACSFYSFLFIYIHRYPNLVTNSIFIYC